MCPQHCILVYRGLQKRDQLTKDWLVHQYGRRFTNRERKNWRRPRQGRRLAKYGFKFYSQISEATKPVQSANLSKSLLKRNM